MMFLKNWRPQNNSCYEGSTYQDCDSTLACINYIQLEEYRDQNLAQVLACGRKKNNKKFQDCHPKEWLKSLKWEEVVYEMLQQ